MILESFFLLFRGAGVPRGIAGGSAKKMVLAVKYVQTYRKNVLFLSHV